MRLIIVAVHDRALDAFGRPFFMQSTGQAIRSFGDEVNRQAPDNEMWKHPEDYDLFELGAFEDTDGKLESLKEPKQLAIGKQMKIAKEV